MLKTRYSPDSLSLRLAISGDGSSLTPHLDFTQPDINRVCRTVWDGSPTPAPDSLFRQFVNRATKRPPGYSLQKVTGDSQNIILDFRLDLRELNQLRDSLLLPASYFADGQTGAPTAEMLTTLSLVLPCENVGLPKSPDLLPNAPRSYRNGIHRGIDFQANWGTPVRAVAPGKILRADHEYQESTPELFSALLTAAHTVGFTPWDMYYSRLLGQAVIIDHGMELVPGYRTISIYAHLSYVQSDLKPGLTVAAGDLLGRSGNTGTDPSVRGSRNRAHLHWEMIFQNSSGEYYLGQDLSNPNLYRFLRQRFANPTTEE
ncbi:MAG: M23 family metallopeptidase [Fidelibacterota bacterium]